MIIAKLKGGLGNQMFQYAAGLALAERHNTVLKLDVSWFRKRDDHAPHNRYSLSCFNITEQFASPEDLRRFEPVALTRAERWSVRLARLLRLRRYVESRTSSSAWHIQPGQRYYPGFAELPDDSAIEGYFQSENFFTSAASLLRLHLSFRYPAPPAVDEMASRIASGPSVALHFRRGDYAGNPGFARDLGILDIDYYHRALRLVRERSPLAVAYVFSDDIESVSREFTPEGPHEFVRCVDPRHSHDSLRLMSLCRHQIIANSTFSWWAAWLNPFPGKIVVAPSPWFADPSLEPADLVTENWIRLPRLRASSDGRP